MRDEFLLIRCRGYKIVHGFDGQNKEIEEVVNRTEWTEKIIAISRIQNVTEKYIRMSYSHDRIIYWEYEGGLERMKKALQVTKV